MAKINLITFIDASADIVFDLARDVDAHQLSTSTTKERAIAGRTSGLCQKDDIITWEAIHFGIKQRLTVRITKMNKPLVFEDEMVKGAFKSMKHVHTFKSEKNGTEMTDEFEYEVPLGFLGKLADSLFLKRYMTKFLSERNSVLKQMAEKKMGKRTGG